MAVDLGTGDGLFVYHSARQNPDRLYIGIDTNARPLEKISEKVHRKPSRGGAPNALYVLASAENLPEELNGVASEIYVHFPWGSLLRAVAVAEPIVLHGLRRICRPDATLRILLGLDPRRDLSEIHRLGLPDLTQTYIESVLSQRYRAAGFEVTEVGTPAPSEVAKLQTSWARRLRWNETRVLYLLVARARGILKA